MLFQPPLTAAALRPRTQARTHTQADADAGADVKHAWRRLRDADGSACKPSVRATAFILAQNNKYVDTLRHDGGDSLVARDVVPATADRGGTAPAHADTHTRTQRQTQTPVPTLNHTWWRLGEVPTHRRKRTNALSAHDGIHSGAKQFIRRHASP